MVSLTKYTPELLNSRKMLTLIRIFNGECVPLKVYADSATGREPNGLHNVFCPVLGSRVMSDEQLSYYDVFEGYPKSEYVEHTHGICAKCDERVRFSFTLVYHMRDGIIPCFKCEECGEVYPASLWCGWMDTGAVCDG